MDLTSDPWYQQAVVEARQANLHAIKMAEEYGRKLTAKDGDSVALGRARETWLQAKAYAFMMIDRRYEISNALGLLYHGYPGTIHPPSEDCLRLYQEYIMAQM